MGRIAFLLVLLASIVAMTSCSTLGPVPTSPQVYMTVYIDSIPSGSDVYAFDTSSHTMGRHLGVTPMEIKVGIARRNLGGKPCRYTHCQYVWCNDFVHWGENIETPDRDYSVLLMSIATHKEGYSPTIVNNKRIAIFGYDRQFPPDDIHLTIPLRGGHSRSPSRSSDYGNQTSYDHDRELAQARKEYNLALQEYQDAKAKYDATNTFTGISDFGWMGKKGAAFGLANNEILRSDARRNLEIARERLERAKDRLHAAEMR